MSSSTGRTPTRISVDLVPRKNSLVLDLQRGLSSNIGIHIRNYESEPVTLCFPGLKQDKEGYTNYDFIEALDKGAFLFQHEGSGEVSAPYNLKRAPTARSEPAQIVIDAGDHYYCNVLLQDSQEISNIGLRAGEIYLLQFAHTSQKIKCKFSGPGRKIPEPFSPSAEQNDLVDIDCIGVPIRVRVVPGVPIPCMPRLQVSLQSSSRICYLSGSSPLFMKLTMKYLDSRPLTINMGYTPYTDLQVYEDLITLTDTATDKELEQPHVTVRYDGQGNALSGYYVEFNEGTEYNQEWCFDHWQRKRACLQPDRTYVVELKHIRFDCWHYGSENENLDTANDLSYKLKIQPEIVEVEPTFANIIENIFERQRSEPFFRLPRELRDQIYGNLKSSNPSRLFFRTVAESGPRDQEGALPIDFF